MEDRTCILAGSQRETRNVAHEYTFEKILQTAAFLPDPTIFFSKAEAGEVRREGRELEEPSDSTVPAPSSFINWANDIASPTQSSTTCGPLLWLERWNLVEA